jgi:transaldolase
MKIFLDSANLEQIARFSDLGWIDGVTTNPSLLAKEGIKATDNKSHIAKICEIVSGPVSIEVNSLEYSEMLAEALEYAKIAPNIYVKLPCTEDGLRVCLELKTRGIHTNVTLVFTATQALMAAKSGATLVSPFIGRLEDAGQDGLLLVEEIVQIFTNYNFDTLVLSASFRSVKQIKEVALIGSDIATISPELMSKIISSPFTDKGLEDFQRAAGSVK